MLLPSPTYTTYSDSMHLWDDVMQARCLKVQLQSAESPGQNTLYCGIEMALPAVRSDTFLAQSGKTCAGPSMAIAKEGHDLKGYCIPCTGADRQRVTFRPSSLPLFSMMVSASAIIWQGWL